MALKKIGAFWLAEKNGKKYFRGTTNEAIPSGAKLFVYRNDYKENEKHPDYTLHMAVDDEERPERPQEQSQVPENPEIPF